MPMNALSLLADIPAWEDDAHLEHVELWEQQGITYRWLSTPRYIAAIDVQGAKGDAWDAETRHGDGSTLVLCEDDNAVALAVENTQDVFLCFSDLFNVSQISQFLTRRLARYARWLYDLHEAATHPDGSLDKILAIARQLIGHSLVLFDGSFNFLAYNGDDLPRSEALAQTIEHGYAMGVDAAYQREYRELQATSPNGFETYFQEGNLRTPVWSQGIRTRDGRDHRLHAMGITSRQWGLRALIGNAADAIRVLLERLHSMATSIATSEDLVQELVLRCHDESETRSRARFLGGTTRHNAASYAPNRIASRSQSRGSSSALVTWGSAGPASIPAS